MSENHHILLLRPRSWFSRQQSVFLPIRLLSEAFCVITEVGSNSPFTRPNYLRALLLAASACLLSSPFWRGNAPKMLLPLRAWRAKSQSRAVSLCTMSFTGHLTDIDDLGQSLILHAEFLLYPFRNSCMVHSWHSECCEIAISKLHARALSLYQPQAQCDQHTDTPYPYISEKKKKQSCNISLLEAWLETSRKRKDAIGTSLSEIIQIQL